MYISKTKLIFKSEQQECQNTFNSSGIIVFPLSFGVKFTGIDIKCIWCLKYWNTIFPISAKGKVKKKTIEFLIEKVNIC